MNRSTRIVATLGATVGFVLQYVPPFRWTLGPRSRWWELIRRALSRFFGYVFDRRAGPRPITEHEYAGTIVGPLDAVEGLLWEHGFRRNPLSRLKTRNGAPEAGSWVFRASPLAERQLHLMLFRSGETGVDVYAHSEQSSVNPFVGGGHFRGSAQNVAEGVEEARRRLSLEQYRDTPTPPAGPWSQTDDSGKT